MCSKATKRRVWTDVDQTMEFFKPWYDIEDVLDFGKFPVSVQARMFNKADAMLMVHGAQMANLVFAKPGIAVLELSCTGYSHIQGSLTQALGIKLRAISTKADPRDKNAAAMQGCSEPEVRINNGMGELYDDVQYGATPAAVALASLNFMTRERAQEIRVAEKAWMDAHPEYNKLTAYKTYGKEADGSALEGFHGVAYTGDSSSTYTDFPPVTPKPTKKSTPKPVEKEGEPELHQDNAGANNYNVNQKWEAHDESALEQHCAALPSKFGGSWDPHYRIAKHSPISTNPLHAQKGTKGARILCWIFTVKRYHKTKAAAAKIAWGDKCDKLIFFSDEEDESLPAVKLVFTNGGADNSNNIWGKTQASVEYLEKHFGGQYDWYVKGDDDTLLFPENLRRYLLTAPVQEEVAKGKGVYLGRRMNTTAMVRLHSSKQS
jgi:hypothetical protein